MSDTSRIAHTRKGAYLALIELAKAAESAAANLARTDYETVFDYCEETREWLADRDDSIPVCQVCGNNKVREPQDESHPRCSACQAQHDDDAAINHHSRERIAL